MAGIPNAPYQIVDKSLLYQSICRQIREALTRPDINLIPTDVLVERTVDDIVDMINDDARNNDVVGYYSAKPSIPPQGGSGVSRP
jgi:hypothetical protein